jgi:hypothetical protein
VEGLNKASRRWFNSIATVVIWELWKEHNEHIFKKHAKTMPALFSKFVETASDWCEAGRLLVHDLLSRPREPD